MIDNANTTATSTCEWCTATYAGQPLCSHGEPVSVWDLDLDCGQTVRREFMTAYPAVSVFDCPCVSSSSSCSVEYRRLVVDNTATATR